MSELRWTLLILGVVFIAALSWWERRRPRQAFAPRLRDASLSHTELSRGHAQRTASAEPPVTEPWIGEAGLADVASSGMALGDAAGHEPAGDGDAREQAEASAPGPLEELPTLIIPDADERLALRAAWDEQPPEPTLIDPEATTDEALASMEPIEAAEPEPPLPPEPVCVQETPCGEETPRSQETPRAQETSQSRATSLIEAMRPAAARPVASNDQEPEIAGAEGVGAVRIVESAFGGDGAAPVEPIVEWPAEESRRILALRLVAPQAARFPGRTLRLALAAEGFVLGKFSIFHKPDETNRAVLSVAALTRPGAFDLETMDSQRYGGLSLFAVLPGPKTPPQAFEELLATARNLNERLEGALQDERGGPLTALRVSSIRDSLRAEAVATHSAAAAHGR